MDRAMDYNQLLAFHGTDRRVPSYSCDRVGLGWPFVRITLPMVSTPQYCLVEFSRPLSGRHLIYRGWESSPGIGNAD